MKTLILTRHAKSSWDTPLQDDHDRPLNPRGRKAAQLIGQWMAKEGLQPGEVLVSDARRTLETWARISTALAPGAMVRPLPGLYHASPTQMLNAVQAATADQVLLIGHNPGIAEFAAAMVEVAPDHPRFHDYPTAASCVIDFDIANWSQVRAAAGRCRLFVTPREL